MKTMNQGNFYFQTKKKMTKEQEKLVHDKLIQTLEKLEDTKKIPGIEVLQVVVLEPMSEKEFWVK